MNVHLFGNGPSPAVATYGLRRTVVDSEEEYGMEAKKFICRNFYVDDGLTSLSYTQGATDLVKSAQATLATANLRLHILVSNSVEVMEAFLGRRPPKRRAWSGITSRQLQLTSSTFARSILGPGDRCLYRLGIFAGEAIHKERSTVHRQLCVRPAWFCSTCYAQREKETAAACTYGTTDKGEQCPVAWENPLPTA